MTRPEGPGLSHELERVRPRQQMEVVDPMLRGEVGRQASLSKFPPVRPMNSVQAGEIRVLRQAGTDPAREEHHNLGLGAVGFQADTVEEVDEQVEGVLQKGGVAG